jgi:peptide chain release factor subunit 1
MDPNQKIMD